MIDYKSPISIIQDEMHRQIQIEMENEVMKCVQNVGVHVDRQELIKALQYDRGQYEKGYQKGYQDGLNADKWIPVEETLPESCEYVLVWCKGNFVGGTHEGEETEWYGIGILCNDRWTIYQCKDIKNIEVIAWSFMPQPYKKEGAE